MNAPPDKPTREEPAYPTRDASASGPSAGASDPSALDASTPAPEPSPPRRGRAVSMLGMATAGLGIVLAVLGIATLIVGRDSSVSALDARLAGVELHLRELAARPATPSADPKILEEVTSRLAKLEAAAGAAPRSAGSDAALADRLAGLETELKTLAEIVGALGRRNEETLAAAREARARADAGAAALAELAQKIPDASAAVRSELEALGNRVAALERSEKAAERGDRAVRLALAASALNGAVERGEPFATELATVKALGGAQQLVAALEPFVASGVPTPAVLAREFADVAPSLQASAAPREGVLGKLAMNAEKLIRIRRIDETPGSDPAAILARSEAKILRGDIAGGLAELAQLSPQARAPAETWIKRAQAPVAARDASRRLSADALAGLGK
jgi:Mitochondrial inner membrane protein